MSEYHSFGSNYHGCSQSRKISVGVLVDSPNDMKAKSGSKEAKQVAENAASRKENLVVDCEGHTPFVEKSVKDLQKDASPWFSTKSFNINLSSSAAVHDAKITQSFQVATRTLKRSKRSKEASVHHPVKLFACKRFGLESDKDRPDKFGKASCAMGARNVSNAENVENLSPKSGFLPENDLEKDKNRRTEPGGSETLRMKLWEIIGKVSSPNKQCVNVQPMKIGSKDLNPNLERNGKDSSNEKTNPHSDTIESDSVRPEHIIRKPLTHSLTRKKASSKKQHNKIETKNSTSHKKDCQEKGTFPVRGEQSRRPCETVDTSFLHCNSLIDKTEGVNFENPEERWQSRDNSKSIPSLWTSMLQGNKAENGNSSNDRKRNILGEIESDTKIRNSDVSPNNVTTEPPSDVGTLRFVETPKFKYQREDTMNSLSKNRRDHTHNPENCTFERKSTVESPGCSPFGIQLKDHDLSNAEKKINMKSTRRSKILIFFKSTENKSNVQDGCGEMKDYPPLKPTSVMEQDGEQSISGSSRAATDSEKSEDDFHIKGCRKLETLPPEIGITRHFLQHSSRRLCNEKGVDVTGCSPISESFKGNDEISKFQMCMEQDHEDGFARAVALLIVALDRVQTKMKSMIDKRSAEILMEAADEIYLHLHHAESQMKKDVGKLINHSKLKRRCLDAKFQEQHEQLVGIHKRFKLEVDQHLQDYDHLIEDLEELGTELERNVKRHEASNKKFLSQAEEAVNVQLDDAERKILAAQELAREKLLQLKLAVAECIKHGAFAEIL
ncbi:meiosis-specific protein ASY3 [Primulina tabacum]|uniref:meiosis-specific protein ASY3 n=1 Tax=Primulina tabacum TaxID=48773 RepID=UPI003F5994DD